MRHKLGILLLILHSLLFTLHSATAQHYKVKTAKWKRVEVTKALDAKPDSQALAIIAPYKVSVDSVMSPVLGASRVAMSAKRPESLLSNWAADVMVEGSTATGLPAADMGLVNIGGLRNNMPKGIVRKGDVILISPFENSLVVLELKGKDVIKLMHNIAAVGGEGVSRSVRMVISKDGKLISATINGKKISRRRTYTIATLDYLAEGNDKMYALKKAKKRYEIGMKTRDAMIESIIKHRFIDSKLEGRITISEE
jgi:2',3'-cyclic-nucleotide 2'-phosphodiesterase (5'-nucleotidase family)